MRRIEACAGAAALCLLGARSEINSNKSNPLVEDLQAKHTQTLSPQEATSYLGNFQQTDPKIPDGLGKSFEVTPTPEAEPLINPWKGHVFNQHCTATEDKNTGKVNFDCVEDWAKRPLPGGCSDAFKNYEGSSSCNAVSTAYVLNELVPPETFMKLIGQPGIPPDVLIEKVYPNLPDGKGIVMDCAGAGPDTMKAALHYFGLEVRDVYFSEYTVADIVKSLKPNERLMVGMIGINARGKRFQHWSVAAGVGEYNGHETVYYHDSYFYKDPKNPNYDTVYFEESSVIKNDPTRYTGKDFNYVGGMIVSLPEAASPNKTDYQTEMIAQDQRFVETKIEILDNDIEYLSGSEEVGENRYKLSIRYQGRTSDFYYYDPYGGLYPPPFEEQVNFKWGDYLIPLYRQLDPRWAGIKLDKVNPNTGFIELFGDNSCGLAVAASIFSMHVLGDETPLIDPYLFYKTYFPNFYGGGTTIWSYYDAFEKNDIKYEKIYPTKNSIEKAIDDNKLVMLNTLVNFKKGLKKNMIQHYVLILGRDKKGELLIYDPFWGPFVTTFADLDLSDPESAAFAIGYPQ